MAAGWAPNENGDAEDDDETAAPKPVGGKEPNGVVVPKGVTDDFGAISPNAGVEDVDELKPINGAAVVLVVALPPKDPKVGTVEVAVSCGVPKLNCIFGASDAFVVAADGTFEDPKENRLPAGVADVAAVVDGTPNPNPLASLGVSFGNW